MSQFNSSFFELLKRDRRYKAEAYSFVREALDYAQRVMKLGQKPPGADPAKDFLAELDDEDDDMHSRHITGQELCNAARIYALEQYGMLARTVLDSVGIHKTDDIGEIVYNLIDIGLMYKTEEDRREDFDDVFDFDTAFSEKYRINS